MRSCNKSFAATLRYDTLVRYLSSLFWKLKKLIDLVLSVVKDLQYLPFSLSLPGLLASIARTETETLIDAAAAVKSEGTLNHAIFSERIGFCYGNEQQLATT